MTMKDLLVLWLVGSCAFFSLVGCHLLEQSAQVALCVLLPSALGLVWAQGMLLPKK